jgi:hypothetical protein
MKPPEFIARPRLKFLRSVHPEVVEYLESIPTAALPATVASLLVRAIWDVTGRSHAAGGFPLIQHQSQAHDPGRDSVRTDNGGKAAEPFGQNLDAFGLVDGGLDAFDYS